MLHERFAKFANFADSKSCLGYGHARSRAFALRDLLSERSNPTSLPLPPFVEVHPCESLAHGRSRAGEGPALDLPVFWPILLMCGPQVVGDPAAHSFSRQNEKKKNAQMDKAKKNQKIGLIKLENTCPTSM